MSTDIEQYRPGFEAWARGQNWLLDRDSFGEYRYATARDGWEAWIAAKREASTESAQVEDLRAALRSVNAVAIERGDKYGVCDQIDNAGNPYQSQWFADLLASKPVAGALTYEAKDAALRLARVALENSKSEDVARDVERRKAIKAIDAAIAHTKAQEGA